MAVVGIMAWHAWHADLDKRSWRSRRRRRARMRESGSSRDADGDERASGGSRDEEVLGIIEPGVLGGSLGAVEPGNTAGGIAETGIRALGSVDRPRRRHCDWMYDFLCSEM